ncbi:MAG: acylneuraminate cytidylyltransferase family protein [Patescibacteria group bacterium]
MSNKSLAVITARGGSKGVPRKNIRLLNGKPLLWYSLTAALSSNLLTRVVVSSDDDEILAVAKQYGGERVVLKRPSELALDNSPSLPVVQHAVLEIEKRDGVIFDYVLLIQPTTPFILSSDIDNMLKLIIDTDADSVVSVCEINDTHPVKIKKIVDGRLVQYIDGMEENVFRRQDLPTAYKRNGGIYVNKRSVVMDKNSLHGNGVDCRAFIMPIERSVDINTPADFLLAEVIARNFKLGVPKRVQDLGIS